MSYPPPSSPQPYPPPPQGGGYGAPPTRLRGRTPLRLALVFLIVGIALVVVGGVIISKKSLGAVDHFDRVRVADGTGMISFGNPGNYVAYYEAHDISSSTKIVPPVRVAIQSPTRKARELTTPYGGRTDGKIKPLTYDYNGHHGVARFQFKITEKGTYQVEVQGGPGVATDADIAFGKSIAGGIAVGAVLVFPGVLLLIAALVLFIVGLVKRSGHKKELAAAPYGGGGAPFPPQGLQPPGAWPAPPQG